VSRLRPPSPSRLLALVALYAGGLIALTAPVWKAPTRRVLGQQDSDVWKHLWGDDWLRRSLGERLAIPLETNLIGFPDGGLLYNLDPLTGFAVWLLAPLTGLVLAHNLAQVGALLLGAVGAYALATHLLRDRAAAAVAGAIYGFSAHILSISLASGIGETAHIGWLPLATLMLLKTLERPRILTAAAAALCLALSAIGSWYYGLIAGLIAAVVSVWWWMRRGLTRAHLLALTGIAAGALLLVLPSALAFLRSLRADGALNTAAAAGISARDLTPRFHAAVVTLSDLVWPRQPRIQTRRDWLIFANHPGFLVVALALIAAGRARWRPLLLAAVLLLALSLGPTVYLDRTTPLIANPLFALVSLLPGLDMLRNLERFQVAATLALSVLGAAGAARLLDARSLHGGRRWAAGLLLSGLVIAEAAVVSGLPMPLPWADTTVDPIYTRLAQLPPGSGIIELPLSTAPGGHVFWHQLTHRQPIPVNLEGALPESLENNPLLSALIPARSANVSFLAVRDQPQTPADLEAGRLALIAQGFAVITLSQRPDPETDLDAVQAVLLSVLGEPVLVGEGVEVFSLSLQPLPL
jgi:hypothetical protein